jgi:hypothetical protein
VLTTVSLFQKETSALSFVVKRYVNTKPATTNIKPNIVIVLPMSFVNIMLRTSPNEAIVSLSNIFGIEAFSQAISAQETNRVRWRQTLLYTPSCDMRGSRKSNKGAPDGRSLTAPFHLWGLFLSANPFLGARLKRRQN